MEEKEVEIREKLNRSLGGPIYETFEDLLEDAHYLLILLDKERNINKRPKTLESILPGL